ncbi:MAG: hypothetical protein BIFFINMI_03505 [Phycisphaerae bacterium]|nr:hypothetical protein [Phycisphaerae bacterium]
MAKPANHNYYERVYAGVLGKVIGVYVGKPFEGWSNERIERELGEVWYYVQERLNYPLVMADDDISGTFTFLRAMPDHDAWADVTAEQIGKAWLNYLIEHQTVLWWGGLGVSTEHTAWLRLAAGVPAPRSGSIALNGATVAEQIGAQIFIDGWGMVAPGAPKLAARLAGEAGRVSHDGEAVYAAQLVAAMESAAFVESDMDKLLDIGLGVIPDGCLIARIHRDVRGWAADHGDDWRKTLADIQAKYGYDRYGGGCHVVPNHAVMVMAWAHAPDDFQRSLMIANTAGWDTDCNSGNVGCLMGIKDGLAGIAAGPNWQQPFADRLLIPTAEGTHGVTDCLREADAVAAFGRRVMGWDAVEPPKGGARFHFSQPGALHGFMPLREVRTDDSVRAVNRGGRLRIEFDRLAPGKPARVVTPTYLDPDQLARGRSGSYAMAVVPTLYSGQAVTATVSADAANAAPVTVCLFARAYRRDDASPSAHKARLGQPVRSEPVLLPAGGSHALCWTLPDTGGWPIADLGIEVDGPAGASGAVEVDAVDWSGAPAIAFDPVLPKDPGQSSVLGWILDTTLNFRYAWGKGFHLVANHRLGTMHTGTREWTDYAVEAHVSVRLADAAGVAARYQGLRRYLALLICPGTGRVELVRQFDDERQVLATAERGWALNEAHRLRLEVRGGHARGLADGKPLFDAAFEGLADGGVALLADRGSATFDALRVTEVQSAKC